MADLVERLRSWKQVRTTPYPIGYYLDAGIKAADEIERLRAEVARMNSVYAGACVQMHGFLMDCGLQNCGFGTPEDWRIKAKEAVERLRYELDRFKNIAEAERQWRITACAERDALNGSTKRS